MFLDYALHACLLIVYTACHFNFAKIVEAQTFQSFLSFKDTGYIIYREEACKLYA